MSQKSVERVIGLLVTDEWVRDRFSRDPRAVLGEMVRRGMELTESEQRSLASLDPREIARFVQSIDPRLQKADLQGGDRSWS